MKKNLNIIQIKGIMGILYIAFIGICLIAGFGWFPGWLCMHSWNFLSSYVEQMPAIGIIQGILLWGIIAAAYFTFRKDRLVVCMKASEGLSEEELKAVFAEMKKQAQDDTFLRNMLKARNTELKIKNLAESNITKVNIHDIENLSQKNPDSTGKEKINMK